MTDTLKREGSVIATSVPSDLALTNLELASVQLHKSLGNRQSKTGALTPAGMTRINLGERRQRDRDLFLRHADASIADADALRLRRRVQLH